MTLLAIDCANDACSVAVLKDGRICFSQCRNISRGQAECLIPMCQTATESVGGNFQSFDKIAVTVGPGSFTGVRIGLSAAKGLAMAADLPMVGVDVLTLLASFYPDKKVASVVDTKRQDCFVRVFDKTVPLQQASVLSVEETERLPVDIFVGNGSLLLSDSLIKDERMPTAVDVAFFAEKKEALKEYPLPLYLREAEVTVCPKK